MQAFTFHIPVKTLFGKGQISRLNQEIPSHTHKILIVTDPGLYENTGIVQQILAQLQDKDIRIFKDIEENPTLESIDQGGTMARDFKPGLVLGIGGGSAMDAAKGVANQVANPPAIACIPTTSGTGSEVTPFAVFTDPENETKLGFSKESYFPKFSIIDPELTYSMPDAVLLNTGLDSLAHAIEAYLSTESFDLNDQLALHSIKQVINNLEDAVQRKQIAMDTMAYSAMLSGMAITHASTILPHIMGYPLTVYHGVPHGRAGTLLIPPFIDYLREINTCPEKVNALDELFKKTGGIRSFLENLGVSLNLRDYGVEEGELDKYVQKTIVKGDVRITPGNIDEKVIREIYLRGM